MRNALRHGLRRYRADTVLLHTKDGESYRGVLVEVWKDIVVLRHCSPVDDPSSAMAGDVIVERPNISIFQVVSA